MEDYVISTIDDRGLLTIEFFTINQNSLPSNIISQLVEAINSAGNNPLVKLILVKSSEERVFCAGASFDELLSINNHETGCLFFSGFANIINAIRKCPKIIIGRVQGKAVGGGVGLAASFDYCLASHHASIKLSELAIGIGPFVIGPAVERKMGLSAFSQMALNATEWQTAQWAKQNGLFNEVFETIKQLDDYTDYFINILLNSSQEALFELKKTFWVGYEHWDQLLAERAAISGRLVLSDFAKKAISALKPRS